MREWNVDVGTRGRSVRRWWILTALAVALAVLSGCGTPGTGASAVSKTGSISGVVTMETLDLKDGDVSGLMVYVKELPGLNTRTTIYGSFSIGGVPPGTYTVALELPQPPPDAAIAVTPPGGQAGPIVVKGGVQTINVDFHIETLPAPPTW